MKGIDKKNLAAIKKFHAQNDTDKVVSFILDSLTRFMKGEPNATYNQAGAALFVNVDDLQQNIRKINHSALDAKTLDDMMVQMTGRGNQDIGDVTTDMSSEKNIKKYLNFYSFFKTVSKMCHLAMTVRKEINIKKQIEHNQTKVLEIAAKKAVNEKLIESLNFYQQIDEEIARLQTVELPMIDSKSRRVAESKAEISQKLYDFNAHYFQFE